MTCPKFILPLLTCGVLLASCALSPAGYKYENTEYGTPIAHPAKNIGYMYTPTMNDKSLQIWQNIVISLLNELEYKRPYMSKVLYLPLHQNANLFINSYDFALRQELYKRGYTLATDGHGVPNLYYEAHPANTIVADAPAGTQNATFTLIFTQRNLVQNTVTQDHLIPAFYTQTHTHKTYANTPKTYEMNVNNGDYQEYKTPPHYNVFSSGNGLTLHPQRTNTSATAPTPAHNPYPPAGYKRSTED